VANFSLRRYDTQARASVALAIASCVSFLAMTALVFRHANWGEFMFPYGNLRKMLILVAGACTLLLAAAGFGMGLNSAGQRRNDKQRLSWVGFFVSAGVLCLTLVILFLFRSRGDPIITSS
jgi:hypothetical protein